MIEPESLEPNSLVFRTVNPSNEIIFRADNLPNKVMKLTKEGMFYNGEFIEDAGKAHRLFIEFMERANSSKDLDEL